MTHHLDNTSRYQTVLSQSTYVKKYWWTVLLALILLLFSWITFYKASYFATYNSETAQHYLEIRTLGSQQLLLSGPRTSHEWLRLSATPYYLFYPLFALTHFHPLTLSLLWSVSSIGMVALFFFVSQKSSSTMAALLATLLFATSSSLLQLQRQNGFFAFVPIIMLMLLWQSKQIIDHKPVKVWTVFLLISLACCLHASAILLIPFFILFLLIYRKFSRRTILQSLIGFVVPQLPLILLDAQNSFTATTSLFLWVPYKMVNFVTGQTLGVDKIQVTDHTTADLLQFLSHSFFPASLTTSLAVLLFALGVGVLATYFAIRQTDRFLLFNLLFLIFGLLSLGVHKNPPFHYFVPLLVLPCVILGQVFGHLLQMQKTALTAAVYSITLMLVLLHSSFIFSPAYLFATREDLNFAELREAASSITQRAKQQPVAIYRVGEFDSYADQFKENYRYILQWQGTQIAETATNSFIIVEGTAAVPDPNAITIFDSPKVRVYQLSPDTSTK